MMIFIYICTGIVIGLVVSYYINQVIISNRIRKLSKYSINWTNLESYVKRHDKGPQINAAQRKECIHDTLTYLFKHSNERLLDFADDWRRKH